VERRPREPHLVDGITPEEIQVDVEGAVLHVKAHHVERSQSGESTSRESLSVSAVPRDVDADAATSRYDAATHMLTVTLPKVSREKMGKRQILVRARGSE
jgi:HSP20 family molecular chaperone IbpA